MIPLWLKVAYTAYVALLVPFYWGNYWCRVYPKILHFARYAQSL